MRLNRILLLCLALYCLGAQAQVISNSGGGVVIPATSKALAGDGSGNAIAVTGTGSNCVHADGSSAACSGGGATIPSTTNVLIGDGAGNGASSGHANPAGAFVGTTDTQTLTNKTVDGVSPATFGFLDPTSSVQTQLNSKGAGTVTSIICGTGLTGGTITTTGTCAADSSYFNINWAQLAVANTFSAGSTQTFQDSATTGGFRAVPAADPSSPVAGNCKTTLAGQWECWTGSAWQLYGTLTTIGFTGGLISVASPTTAPALTVAGTSGGLPYFSSASTWASSAAGTINHVIGWGGAGNAPVDLGVLPSGTPAFSAITTGTNATTLLIGTSGSLDVSGSGTINATSLGGSAAALYAKLASPTFTGTVGLPSGQALTSPALTTPTVTTSETLTNTAITTTTTDGYVLQNTTAATVGAQKFSPAIDFSTNGWKTNSTAGSQSVKWTIDLEPVQSSINPDDQLVFVPIINGVAKPAIGFCSSPNGLNGTSSTGLFLAGANGCNSGTGYSGFFSNNASNIFNIVTNASDRGNFNNNGILLGSASSVMFASGSSGTSITGDVTLDRDAAGILGVQSGAQGTTAANYRAIKASAHMVGGTTFTATGLSVGTLVGGATAGTFALGANGPGTVVVTMGNSATAATGWSCWVSDRTTLTIQVEQSASSTTTATFNYPAGALNGDVSNFGCLAY